MRTPTSQLIQLAVAIGLLSTPAWVLNADDLVIIANRSVKTDTVSSDQARDVFIGESNSLGGFHVVPVVLEKGPVQQMFLQMLGKTESAFSATWRKQVFTGKGVMPHACASEDQMIAYVSATPGAIGFISAAKAQAGVKILKRQ
jgi:hypothetical protein